MRDKEYRNISTLKAWKKNPRSITKEGLERLKVQLKRLGQYKPLIITKDGTVLGGNMRLKAYKEMGINDVWVSTVEADTEEAQLEYALSDNDRAGKYEFDELITLAKDFPAIKWADYSVDLQEPTLLPELKDLGFLDTFFNRVQIDLLKPNKYGYRQHSPEQINHLVKSIQQNGIYKNIIVANDYTILDGHAVVEAAKQMKIKVVPIKKLDIEPDSDQALKIVISNNEMGKFAETDDRKLTEALKLIKENNPDGLKGTGFDEMMLSNLLMVTRRADEIGDFSEAAEWVGMPDYLTTPNPLKLTVNFDNLQHKAEFFNLIKQSFTEKTKSIWYPYKENDDINSVKFE